MIRILHLIESLRPGGAEQLLRVTIRHLSPARFRSVVVALSPPLDLGGDLERLGIAVHCLNVRGPVDLGRGVLALSRLLHRYRIDVLHTHLFFANVCGRMASVVARTPVVVSTYHNADYANEDTGRLPFKLRKLGDMLTAWWVNSGCIAVSEAVREDCRRHLGLKQVELVYNWIDVEDFTGRSDEAGADPRREFGFAKDDFVLINVAKLRRKQKGQQYLIQAMPEIRSAIPRARVVLVGDGPDRAPLEQLSRSLGLGNAVVFAGQRRDIARLLAMADVFVFPSVYEGFGIALVEAMAMGKPAVASRVEGVREIVDDGVNGLLVEPRSSGEIARAVLRLHDDPTLRATLGEEARRVVAEHFSVKSGIGRLEEIYMALVRGETLAFE